MTSWVRRNGQHRVTEEAHERARSGDRRRRPDRADAGGRAGAGGRRRRHRRTARRPGARRARAPAVCTPAPSRCSTSAASPTGSSPRGRRIRASGYAEIPLDISDFPTRHNYVLALWQRDFERILAGWVDELGVPILRGREVAGFAQDDDRRRRRAVRRHDAPRASTSSAATGGAAWSARPPASTSPGSDPSTSWMIAEVEMDEPPSSASGREGGGIGPVDREHGGGPYRRRAHGSDRSTTTATRRCDDLREALVAVYGTDFGVHSPTWISRFTDMTRQAASYRDRARAARRRRRPRAPAAGRPGPEHRRAGRGEPGLEAGPGGRRDVTRRACSTRTTPSGIRSAPGCCATRWRRSALGTPDDRHQALRDIMAELLGMDEPRRRIRRRCSPASTSTTTSARAIRCSGAACPTSTCSTADGPTRVFTLLHDARPGAPRPRRIRRLRPRALGRPRPAASTPTTTARGSSPCSARSTRRPPC